MMFSDDVLHKNDMDYCTRTGNAYNFFVYPLTGIVFWYII